MNMATCSRCPAGKYQSLAGQPFCESVQEGLFISSEPAQVVDTTISLPNQASGTFTSATMLVLISRLAEELGVDAKYIRLEDTAVASSRHRTLLALQGLSIEVVVDTDNGSIVAAKLAELTSSAGFWDSVNAELTNTGISVLATENATVTTKPLSCSDYFDFDNNTSTNTSTCVARLVECKKGSYAAAGTGECAMCPSGKYADMKAAFACESCPSNANSTSGTSSRDGCLCDSGYYQDPEAASACVVCPPNSGDGQRGLTLSTLPATIGHWRAANDSRVFHPCPPQAACIGTAIISDVDDQCGDGYVGLLCRTCDTGFVIKVNQKCGKCEDGEGVRNLGIALVVLAFIAIGAVRGWFMYQQTFKLTAEQMRNYARKALQRRTVPFRTLIGFVQVVTRLPTTFRFTFPPAVGALLNALSIFEVVDIFSLLGSPSCLVQPTYFVQLYIKVLTPVSLLIVIFAAYWGSKSERVRAWFFDAFIVISFIMYPSLCNSLFSYFDCKAYEDGVTYLMGDPTVVCTSDVYKQTLSFVLPLAFVVPVAIPLWYYLSMRPLRNKLVPALADSDDHTASLQAMKQQLFDMYTEASGRAELSAAMAKVRDGESIAQGSLLSTNRRRTSAVMLKHMPLDGTSSAASLHLHLDLAVQTLVDESGQLVAIKWMQLLVRAKQPELAPTQTLWSPYSIHCWWFEIYMLFAKLCLTGLPLLTRRWLPGMNGEALVAEALNIATLLFIEIEEPYVNESDSKMMAKSQVILAIITACGTGTTEISAGSSSYQSFTIVVVFGVTIPGALALVYAVFDPNFKHIEVMYHRCCFKTANLGVPSKAVHPSPSTESMSGDLVTMVEPDWRSDLKESADRAGQVLKNGEEAKEPATDVMSVIDMDDAL
jgi:hypothetical protein